MTIEAVYVVVFGFMSVYSTWWLWRFVRASEGKDK